MAILKLISEVMHSILIHSKHSRCASVFPEDPYLYENNVKNAMQFT